MFAGHEFKISVPFGRFSRFKGTRINVVMANRHLTALERNYSPLAVLGNNTDYKILKAWA
jgi:hypothetical protein